MHELKGLNMLLLFTKGRHTGKFRHTPLLYIEDSDRYYCAASFAGSDRDPEWYLNLVADPNVELLIRRRRIAAKARLTEGKERKEAWRKLVEYYPSFATYQDRTKRTIPVVMFRLVSDSTKN